MKKIIFLLTFVILSSTGFHGTVQAEIVTFSIQGVYENISMQGVDQATDDGLSIAVGDAFIITGTYDTGAQPEVVYGDGSTGLIPDVALDYRPTYPYYIFQDFSSVVSLDFSLLDGIATTYGGYTLPFSDTEIAEESYVLDYEIPSMNSWHLVDVDGDHELNIGWDLNTGVMSGWIDYRYELIIEGDPEGIHTETWKHNSVEFSISQIQIMGSTVPEPSTLLLLGFGLAGLAGFGRKTKAV